MEWWCPTVLSNCVKTSPRTWPEVHNLLHYHRLKRTEPRLLVTCAEKLGKFGLRYIIRVNWVDCCYFASAAVAVDSSSMTASSSASWSRFSPPSNFVNGHVSTVWFMVCRWPQSQEGDWVRPHLCKLAVNWLPARVVNNESVAVFKWRLACVNLVNVYS